MIPFKSANDFSPLGAHQVHLLLCDFSQLEVNSLEQHLSLLSPSEQTKINHFKRRRAQALATRLFVRVCLAQYAQQSPASLEFFIDDQGKPEILHQPFRFNLSHSGEFALIGVSLASSIGVDLQERRLNGRHLVLAERYFHSNEIAALKSLDENSQADYFVRLWTLKEAFFKALGTGISTGLDKVCFDLKLSSKKDDIYFSGTTSLHAEFSDSLNQRESDWQFAQVELMEHFHAAVAVQNLSSVELKWFNGNELFERL